MAGMIPNRDADSLLWMQQFSDGVNGDLTVYHLTSTQGTAISTAVANYAQALTTATTPSVRTEGTVAAKNDAKKIAVDICRQYGILIKFNETISDQAKLDVGIKPVKTTREPVNVPTEAPNLITLGATTGSQVLKFVGDNETERAKPKGASDLLLFVAVSETEVNSPDEAQFYGKVTKNPITVMFEPSQNGKIATYFARWGSRRGQVGAWSAPVSMAIAA